MILIQAKHCQKTVETSQPPLNALPVFIITEQTVLVQYIYVKRRSLLSLHLARTLEPVVSLHLARTLRAFCHHIYTVSYSDYTTKRRS